MELIKMDCPNCGAHLERKQDQYFAKCPYCDTEIAFDSLRAEATVGAYQQQVNTYESLEEQRAARQKKAGDWNRIRIILIIAYGVLNFLGFMLVGYCSLRDTDKWMGPGVLSILLAFALFWGGPIALTVTVPDRDILTGEKLPGIRVRTCIKLFLINFGVSLLSTLLAALFFVD